MKKRIMITSLVLSVALYVFFEVTGNEVVLAPVLLGLLVSFVFAMMFLTEK